MTIIEQVHAIEILDSRGRPTIQCTCRLASGVEGTASIPSGASTGSAEALELRDGDPKRYRGLGCRKAVSNVNNIIQPALSKQSYNDQFELDDRLIQLDGTANKSHLGANAILAVSISFARAIATERNQQLYEYFATLVNNTNIQMPRPMINLFSGGKHAGGQVEIQDIQIIPLLAPTIDEVLRITFGIYYTAAELITTQYGTRTLRADEGGLAPPFPDVQSMFQFAVQAIETAGHQAGQDVALTVDVAASHFYDNNYYQIGNQHYSSPEMVQQLLQWVHDYPIYSVEDGLAEEDWDSWKTFSQQVAGRALVLGDDLLCTHPERIKKAIYEKAANALLLKVNQIGTLSEAATSHNLARATGWQVVISARSGETEDDWLADLAVGWSADCIKVGSITQSERLAKYNRLLTIEGNDPTIKMRKIVTNFN